MSRKRGARHVSTQPGERASIGDAWVNEAVANINRMCQKAMAVMTDYTPTREATLHMLFRDEDMEAMARVRGMVTPQYNILHYEIEPRTFLHINYDGAKVPAIDQSRLAIYRDRAEPLFRHIDAARAVHDRYEEIKGVLRWLNRNATPGAVRYLWPSAMKLCPQAPIWRDLMDVPARYTTPLGVSGWTQAFKDSANTLAQAALLPDDATQRPRQKMWLCFETREVRTDIDRGFYDTDQMIYNL